MTEDFKKEYNMLYKEYVASHKNKDLHESIEDFQPYVEPFTIWLIRKGLCLD